MSAAPISVLVVDDSQVLRLLLVHLLESDPAIRVLGAAGSGAEVLQMLEQVRPDVVLMDIHMGGMDGFEVTRRIMETEPLPIVLCSASSDPKAVEVAFHAIEAGAVALVEKPVASEHADFERLVSELLATVKAMAEVKVVRRWPRSRRAPTTAARADAGGVAVVGIGASTGGPPALQSLLCALPQDFPLPLLIVQHITPGFLPGLAQWLANSSGHPVQIAAHGMRPLPGHAYLAPDDFHLELAADGSLYLDKSPPERGLRPAVDRLLLSLASHGGPASIGVLLTGMGRDGADGLKAMRDRGARTLVQDRQSCVVFGMPAAAVALQAAQQVLPLDALGAVIDRLARERAAPGGRS